ncbi:MAG: antibiotic biosynthesis monooxygenase [Bacteriovoracaceae bacterium]|nr:antibiotic biosynthesis monooxygenase [Bacteriovoracaceae bacterium]
MAIIDQYRSILTVLIEFDVTPGECEEHLAEIKSFFNEVVRVQPGFISTNLHTSLDRTKIVNYAQWKTEQDYQNFLENSEAQKAGEKVLSLKPRTILLKVAFAS